MVGSGLLLGCMTYKSGRGWNEHERPIGLKPAQGLPTPVKMSNRLQCAAPDNNTTRLCFTNIWGRCPLCVRLLINVIKPVHLVLKRCIAPKYK